MPKRKPKKESESLSVIPKTRLGRPCSICLHFAVADINAAIAQVNPPKSFRAISRQFFNNESSRDSIRRHTERCLKLDIHALIEEKRVEQAIDHYNELVQLLNFAKELIAAAREILTDSETGKITLAPNADEIEVVYLDHADTDAQLKPKRKKMLLQKIIDSVQSIEPRFKYEVAQLKSVDIRDFALKTISAADSVLDKFAKVDGHYQKLRDIDYTLTVRAAVRVEKVIEVNRERDKTFTPNVKKYLEIAANDFGVKVEDVEREFNKRTRMEK